MLTEIVAQHQTVVAHELHDGFRTAPSPPPTRADAEAEWLVLHTETVTQHMNADQLSELYGYIFNNTTPSDTTHHALSKAAADHPWDPLDDLSVLAEVATGHDHRTGVNRDEWISVYLEVLNP
jgi:transcriptional antiterminator Rof (Rho-off)